MKRAWVIVRLGEALVPIARAETIDATREYRLLGVRLNGKGPFLREVIPGSQTSATKLFRVQKGDFIYSRLFACRGAFGIVGEELDGSYVSGEFPTFRPIAGKIDLEFLRYWFMLPAVIAKVDADCSGSTPLTRNRFKEHFFLKLEIPLPSLAEQLQIVDRIQQLTAKISAACHLSEQAMKEVEALGRAIFASDSGTKRTPMRELVRLRNPDVIVQPNETYQFAGVYSFGRGVFRGQARMGAEFAYNRLTRLHRGNFVYPKLMAWEGALGVVPLECDSCVVSPEFPVFEVLEEQVLPVVLDTYFRTPSVWPEISGASTGTNVRRRRLNPNDFLDYKIPLPSRATQEKLRAIGVQTDQLKSLQMQTAVELDALLPSILDRAFRGG